MTLAHLKSTSSLRCPPHAREPRLLFPRQSLRPVVVLDLAEAGARQVASPCFEIVVRAVALAAPPFLVVAARVGAEQHAAGLERRCSSRSTRGNARLGT